MSIHFLSTRERDIYNLLLRNDQVRYKLFCFKPSDKKEKRILDYSIFNQIICIDHCNFTHPSILYDTTYLLAKRRINRVIIPKYQIKVDRFFKKMKNGIYVVQQSLSQNDETDRILLNRNEKCRSFIILSSFNLNWHFLHHNYCEKMFLIIIFGQFICKNVCIVQTKNALHIKSG
uniref:DNA-directed RNA polymerase subunit beta n=1 Tax=Cajanus cajan TaxID=3821 RepID=A0A151RXN2_CAJCA|nr:DNA-directed RNA polymerase subunit beta'' [Cajanus cajan]